MSIKISQQGFKIGSRILDENELKVLLPSYDNIFNQINKFRDEASNLSKTLSTVPINSNERFELKKDYNNIFSILGERGTGKTSAIATVRHRIFNSNKDEDIIMPLVVPDDMGETSDTLGWIITYIGEQINILTKQYLDLIKRNQSKEACVNKYTELYDKYCRKDKNTDLNIIFDKVKQSYHFRKSSYKKVLEQEYVGKNEYANDNNEVLSADQNLKKDFFILIEEIIKVKKYLNDEKEPLIYFFFDDVDISAKRGPDVLNTTMRYLTHPNIVTFICGDYKVFSEMLTIEFLKNENLLESELMQKIYTPYEENNIDNYASFTENTAINLRKIRGYDYLKKMLPSALRYEMPKLNNESKANFRYTKNNLNNEGSNNTNKELTLIELIEKSIYTKEELENGKSFLRYKKNIGYSYFVIFDSTPRGLINPYYFLYQMLQYKGKGYDWTSSSIKQFMDIIINSSLLLGSYKEVIEKIIRIYPKPEDEKYIIKDNKKIYNKIDYYIDYSYLESIFDDVINKKDGDFEKVYDAFISIFILAHFFENILVEINRKRGSESKNLHGFKLLCKILNSLNVEGNLYPKINDISRLLYIYYLLNKNMSKINSMKVLKNKEEKYFAWKYFEKVLKELAYNEQEEMNYKSGDMLLYSLFENIFNEDREWVKKKIEQIFEFGMTDRRIFMDIKIDLENKMLNLGLNKNHILNSNELEEFRLGFGNKNNIKDSNHVNYIEKLAEMINSIYKNNSLKLKKNLPYEELLEDLKKIFIEITLREKLEINKEELYKCEDNILEIENKFGVSIFNIVRNLNNIDKKIEKLETLLAKDDIKLKFDNSEDTDIRIINFDKYDNYIQSINEKSDEWEYISTFDPQDIAKQYGIIIDKKELVNKVGYLQSKNMKVNFFEKLKLINYYAMHEELKVIKNYVIPKLEINKQMYESIIDKKRDLESNIIKNEEQLDKNICESSIINNLKKYIDLDKENLNSIQVREFIYSFNKNIIKREITRIIEHPILRAKYNDKNDKLEITRKIINLYEDILDESYENILNNKQEYYILTTSSMKKELKYLNSIDIPSVIRLRIDDLLKSENYFNKEFLDEIVFYATNYIYENDFSYNSFEDRRTRNSEKTKLKVKKIIDILRGAKIIAKKHINDLDREIASNNIDFILEDYIKICTLYKIIITESNGASKKLRQELENLIISNLVNKTSKFNSFKKYIYSLERPRG
ncbi:hypothetical protein JJB46_00290 [Clostridium perfringens]|uniref:hypothetical protein n=1 Tax=Clostridium perfringens TaxID=1502 RepID=UPI00103C1423|nr:hypothetical protein [Clostridium perfringens]MBO3386695.1 hypothetical protein [Clostridium perfringens]MBO3412091.1 hypothetical protein [Clostridium perfringens]TBX10753.1 hypothetical protein BFS04_03510 [Clostridium perfringens]